MEIKYLGNNKHGRAVTTFIKKSENEIFVQFDNTCKNSWTGRDVSINASSYKNSSFNWNGVLINNIDGNILQEINTETDVLLDDFFEIDSGIFILMGQLFETRYGIISLFVTCSVYNEWVRKKRNLLLLDR